MVQVVTKEWEIAKTYIYGVALKKGLMNLDWEDFERKAQWGRPSAAVTVDEPLSLPELMAEAVAQMEKYTGRTHSGVMVVVSYNKGHELMMDELGDLYDSLSNYIDCNEVDVTWGIQEDEEIANHRCVMVFVFD